MQSKDAHFYTADYHVSLYQTPDELKDTKGNPVRPQARYAHDPRYDSPQQDSVFFMPSAPDIGVDDINAIFESVESRFKEDNRFQYSGTTASLTHLDTNGTLTVAYVGDSPVNIFVRDIKSGQLMGAVKMTKDHNPENPDEVERVARVPGGFFADGRIGGHLAITRALGDTATAGISGTPDIVYYDLAPYLDGKYEVLIATESDGVMERGFMAEDEAAMERARAIQEMPQGSHYARALTDLADNGGATDNVSSVVVSMTSLPKENIMSCVFDGHGSKGGTASFSASNMFEQKFQTMRREQDLKRQMEEMGVGDTKPMPSMAPLSPDPDNSPPPGYTPGLDDADAMRIIQSSKHIWRAVIASDGSSQQYAMVEGLGSVKDRMELKQALVTQDIPFVEKETSFLGGLNVLAVSGAENCKALKRILNGEPRPSAEADMDEPMPSTQPTQDEEYHYSFTTPVPTPPPVITPAEPLSQKDTGPLTKRFGTALNAVTPPAPPPPAATGAIRGAPCIPINKSNK